MDIDTQRIRELLDKRDAIDAELASLISGQQTKKPIKCGSCGELNHSARSCTKKTVVS